MYAAAAAAAADGDDGDDALPNPAEVVAGRRFVDKTRPKQLVTHKMRREIKQFLN